MSAYGKWKCSFASFHECIRKLNSVARSHFDARPHQTNENEEKQTVPQSALAESLGLKTSSNCFYI